MQALAHTERTAQEPRAECKHRMYIHDVVQETSRVRLIRLRKRLPADKNCAVDIVFEPGQWLDVQLPGVDRIGGFSITSTPRQAAGNNGYVELAIQETPQSPPAAWLWQPREIVIGATCGIRVGGAFTWPPKGHAVADISRVLLVAGGAGINPLMSMLSHMQETRSLPDRVTLLYSTKSEVLFWPRLVAMFQDPAFHAHALHLFLTQKGTNRGLTTSVAPNIVIENRRLHKADLDAALGDPQIRSQTWAYVCGPPAMTDTVVVSLHTTCGVPISQVRCEKWW